MIRTRTIRLLVGSVAAISVASCGTGEGVSEAPLTAEGVNTTNQIATTTTPTTALEPSERSAPSTTLTVSPEVEMYAEAFGVTIEEAAESLEFQQATTKLIEDVAAQFPNVYTTARYINGADYGLVISVSREVPSGFQDALDEFMRSDPRWEGRITTRRAPHSEAELMEIADDLTDRLSFLDDCDQVSTSLDAEHATLTVELAHRNDRLVARIKEALEGFALPVEYEITGMEFTTGKNCPEDQN